MITDRQRPWLIANYAATIFVSAFLLFQIQPMISRYILPWFGGSPAVWTTCMLFFQSALFAGYAYAHAINRWAQPRWQGVAHLALLAGALLLAHIEPSTSWKPVDASLPTWRILMLLSVCVGAPYFVLATTGPLLQAWFTHHYPGRSPYRLYALSNLGSLLALLSYPFWFEPRFELSQQTTLWFWGYAVFVVLCGLLASRLWRAGSGEAAAGHPSSPADVQAAAGVEVNPTLASESPATRTPSLGVATAALAYPLPTWWRRLLWLLLPAFGSMMLLATTNHVCQDFAPIPLLWVVPFCVYLLTFIIAFDHPRWYRRLGYAVGTIACIYVIGMIDREGLGKTNLYEVGNLGVVGNFYRNYYAQIMPRGFSLPDTWMIDISFRVGLAWHFAALFFICMLCHGELVRLRPPSRYLTSYYLMISAGGALGGIFVSLIAPQIFKTFFEWKLGIVCGYALATCLLLHELARIILRRIFAVGAQAAFRSAWMLFPFVTVVSIVLVGTGLCDVLHFLGPGRTRPVAQYRNFYGTISVWEKGLNKPLEHRFQLYNGSILHGVQYVAPTLRREPTTYYSRDSGVGLAWKYLAKQRPKVRVGTVGLGAGTLAAYGRPGDTVRFYEINPIVIDLIQSGRYFTYVTDLRARHGTVEIVPGDARLSLERESPQHYHLLALDAFSGDAIPTHLLTREAFEIYRPHIATQKEDGIDGAIAIHISNKYLELCPVVMAGAEQLGMRWVLIENKGDDDRSINHSRWMVLSHNEKLLQALNHASTKRKDLPSKSLPWTDEHSDVWSILIR